LPFQGPPKYTQIVIFGLKNITSGNPALIAPNHPKTETMFMRQLQKAQSWIFSGSEAVFKFTFG
jgi:hypothetical protein